MDSVAMAPELQCAQWFNTDAPITPVSYTHLDVYKRQLFYRASIRREFTQQDFQQGGFSGTIRADDADLVAAQNHRAGICLLYTSRCV